MTPASAYRPPPPGWRVFDGRLAPDATVGGYLARGQDVRGTCHQRDCRRRYSLDFDALIRHGYAPFRMSELKALLACRRPGGCAMDFHDGEAGRGLPLRLLSSYAEARVLIRCEGCGWRKLVTPAQMMAQLAQGGAGGGETLHTELAAKLTRPCVQCQALRWACEVTWPEPSGGRNRAGLNLVRQLR